MATGSIDIDRSNVVLRGAGSARTRIRLGSAGGDTAAKYFERTECVAGVQDARFQELMPDIFHWLGITRIDSFASMSDMKYNALVGSGIVVGERVDIPPELIPEDAHVEIEAKIAAGYHSSAPKPTAADLAAVQGRSLA